MALTRRFPLRTAIFFFAVVAAIVLSFVLWESDIREFVEKAVRSAEGNPFLVALILFLVLSSDVVLPVPSVLAGGMCGLLLGPGWGFATAFLALSASSAAGYAIGLKSEKLARRLLGDDEMEFLSSMHKRIGPFLLLGLRPVPVLSEASTVFAGIARMGKLKVAVLVSAGNALVAGTYVSAGTFFRPEEEFATPLFVVCFALSCLFALASVVWKKLARHREGSSV